MMKLFQPNTAKTFIMKNIKMIPGFVSFISRIRDIIISMMKPIGMNLMRNLTNGLKHWITIIMSPKTKNGFRRIELTIYIKTLTGKKGSIH